MNVLTALTTEAAHRDRHEATTYHDVVACEEDAGHRLAAEITACYRAAADGDLETLRALHARGFAWDENTCAMAAWKGQLACLAYAHAHGCPWDSGTCEYAARNGHLVCLQYAREHGCPWNKGICLYVTGSRDVRRWISGGFGDAKES